MATNSLTTRNRSLSSDFVSALEAIVVFQARVVYDEADTIPNHVNRLILAKRAINDPVGTARQFSLVIACEPAIRAINPVGSDFSVPDATLLTAVANQWNMIADAGV